MSTGTTDVPKAADIPAPKGHQWVLIPDDFKVWGPGTIHGMVESVPWDDYRLPAWFWKDLSLCVETGCWQSKQPNPQMLVVRRISGLTRDQVLAAVPTCGDVTCANPAHICVTRKAE